MNIKKTSRKFLITVNYTALVFLFWSAWIGFAIKRGDKFEYHFAVSMVSLGLTMTGHLGSIVLLTLTKKRSIPRFTLILLNYVATFYYAWATYVGFLIRQGEPFAMHLNVSIASFFLSLAAHLLSSLYFIIRAELVDARDVTPQRKEP